jgi:hypothetical protein
MASSNHPNRTGVGNLDKTSSPREKMARGRCRNGMGMAEALPERQGGIGTTGPAMARIPYDR